MTHLIAALRDLASTPGMLPVAGCTDLMVSDPLKLARTETVLDLNRIDELRGIREDGEWVEIGATTTFTEIRHAPLVTGRYPALAAAAAAVGGWQIQNRATIGGNVANASPAGDSLPVLLALGAEVVVAASGGRRTVPYDDFHVGYRKTALGPGELIVALRLPPPAGRQSFRKVGTRQAQAISKVVVAAAGTVESGTVAALRLAAGSVAATPIRLRAAERAAVGLPIEAAAEAAGRAAAAEVTPIDDVRSTAEYRSWVLERVVRRMILDWRQET
jgi:CO/xanthine dehydrogenase FAD-binding subunit